VELENVHAVTLKKNIQTATVQKTVGLILFAISPVMVMNVSVLKVIQEILQTANKKSHVIRFVILEKDALFSMGKKCVLVLLMAVNINVIRIVGMVSAFTISKDKKSAIARMAKLRQVVLKSNHFAKKTVGMECVKL